MTASTTEMLNRQQPAKRSSSTPFGRIAAVAMAAATAASVLTWPTPRWRNDPVGFAKTVLGIEPWDRQQEVLEAVRDHDRVAVASGHKVSKSCTAGIVALWWYASHDDARVVTTCVTARQVDEIFWRECKKLHGKAGRCVDCTKADAKRQRECERSGAPFVPSPRPCPHSFCLDGEPKELARSGLTGDDGFRQVRGFTAKEGEAVAGVSGPRLLYIVDEASGVPQAIFDAIEGNRAGGAKILLLSNPTRTEGEHFDAFHGKKDFYRSIRISSEETPNVKAGRIVVPGLATRAWVEEKEREWGRDSALFKVRVLGEHVKSEDGKIFSLHLIELAEQRWHETIASGRLHVGLDPAGEGESGDETALAARRGQKHLALETARGLNEHQIVARLLGFLGAHRLPGEVPVVTYDATGEIGLKVRKALHEHLDRYPLDFELVGVDASRAATREPTVYKSVRDELLAALRRWMREGGAILEDAKLEKELHAPSFSQVAENDLRQKATDKRELRKLLGRSPDRADALALAVWESTSLDVAPPGAPTVASAATPDPYDDTDEPDQAVDRVFDPYGGRA